MPVVPSEVLSTKLGPVSDWVGLPSKPAFLQPQLFPKWVPWYSCLFAQNGFFSSHVSVGIPHTVALCEVHRTCQRPGAHIAASRMGEVSPNGRFVQALCRESPSAPFCSNGVYSLRVSESRFGNSLNISNSFTTMIYVTVICFVIGDL